MAGAPDQVLAARRRTFTRWVNAQLKSSKLRVEDLEKDLANGVVLVRLLQTFSPHDKALGKYVLLTKVAIAMQLLQTLKSHV